MKNWTETEKRFVNPYNFVPLESKCERKSANEYWNGHKASELLTGYMNCTLTTLTPLIIPNTSNNEALNSEKDTASNSYDFYSYANLENEKRGFSLENYHEPVIPGSELRGVVRSVYEAAFNGCMSVVNGDRMLHRRVTKPKEKAGVLQWNKQDNSWEIIECERVMLYVDKGKYKKYDKHKFGAKVDEETYNRWNEGQVIFIKKANESYKTSSGFDTKFHVADDYKEVDVQEKGWKKGYLHKGEPFSKKHHESVFVPNSNTIYVEHEEIERLQQALEQYADAKLNKNLKMKNSQEHRGYNEYILALKKLLDHDRNEHLSYPSIIPYMKRIR